MSRIIREAQLSDMAEIMKVMGAAKKIMRKTGNLHQWGEGYPSEAVITADMEKDGGFVVEDDGKVLAGQATKGRAVGYFAFYWNGDGVDKDLSECAFWYELAANGGDAQAQFAIGWFHMTGNGVPIDEKKGLKWIHKATFQGYQPAIDYCKENGYKWY